MIVSRIRVDLLIQKKDLKQKNLFLEVDFIFLTQVEVDLLKVPMRRRWKRKDRRDAFQINIKRIYFGYYWLCREWRPVEQSGEGRMAEYTMRHSEETTCTGSKSED